MKCVALVVMMALVAANAQVIISGAYPSFGYRALAAPLSYPYSYSYYGARLAAPFAYAAPAVIPAPIVPTVDFAVPKATFTAKTPGETFVADLPGHFESVVSENLDVAPGTDK